MEDLGLIVDEIFLKELRDPSKSAYDDLSIIGVKRYWDIAT